MPFYQSRRFWLGTLDIVVSFILLLVSTQWPAYEEQVKTLVLAIQPLVVALIIAWTVEGSLRLNVGPSLLPGGRKLWLGILDLVVTFILLLVSVQWPGLLETVRGVLIAVQSIVAALIIAWTADDTIRVWSSFQRSMLGK